MTLETAAQIREQLAQLPPHAEQNPEQRKLYQRLSTKLSRMKADPEKIIKNRKKIEQSETHKSDLLAEKLAEKTKYESKERRWFLEYQLSGKSTEENGENDEEMNRLLMQQINELFAELHIPSRDFERDYTLLNVDPVGRLILNFLGLPLLDITNCYLDAKGLHPMPAKVIVTEPVRQTFICDQEEIQRYQQTRAALLLGVEAEEALKREEHKAHMKQLEKQFKDGFQKMRQFAGNMQSKQTHAPLKVLEVAFSE